MPYQITGRASVLLILAAALSACSPPQKPEPPAPLIFPAPPDQPRFIFERTLRFNENVVKPGKAERFKRFATGSPIKVRGLIKPFDVAAKQGKVFITDTVQRRLVLFDLINGAYKEIGDERPGELVKPLGVCISSKNEVFVSDITAKHIMVFDLDGNYLRQLGSQTIFERPSDVAVSPDGNTLYVVDIGGVDSRDHRVQVVDANNGKLIKTIGTRGSADNEFNLPIQADVAPDGSLYVVDKGNFKIKHFSANGEFLDSFGQPGRILGSFASPKGIAVDKDQNIYVVDSAFGNVQLFNKDHQLLMFIGSRGHAGAPAKYMLPAGIDVDSEGRIYIVDQFFRKVDIYRPYGLEPIKAIEKP